MGGVVKRTSTFHKPVAKVSVAFIATSSVLIFILLCMLSITVIVAIIASLRRYPGRGTLR